MGLLERFLRWLKLTWAWVASLFLFILVLASTMNPFLSVAGAFAPALILAALGVHVHRKTRRWWFESVRSYGHFNQPNYDTSIADFWELIES